MLDDAINPPSSASVENGCVPPSATRSRLYVDTTNASIGSNAIFPSSAPILALVAC
jgi:hypothetical protein